MKVHWFSVYRFSVLGIIGILLLAGLFLFSGNSFGAELQWKKPGESKPTANSVLQVPTVISTDDEMGASTIVQVQAVIPILPPQVIQPSSMQPDGDSSETLPVEQTPSSRTMFKEAPLPPQQLPVKEGTVLCNGKVILQPITSISYDIRLQTKELPVECTIDSNPFYGRDFTQSCVQWKASALSTKAAYFEDVQLERYGHTRFPVLQPVISGTKFFATIPLLPCKMAITPASECVYTLGHYRPGDRSPYMREPCPALRR